MATFLWSLRAKRGNPGGCECFLVGVAEPVPGKRGSSPSGFCSCLIHQAQLPHKLGNYSFKLCLAMTGESVIASEVWQSRWVLLDDTRR